MDEKQIHFVFVFFNDVFNNFIETFFFFFFFIVVEMSPPPGAAGTSSTSPPDEARIATDSNRSGRRRIAGSFVTATRGGLRDHLPQIAVGQN